MQAYLQKEMIPQCSLLNKVCIAKGVFENEYQSSILKNIFLDFKGLF
jgi:hypothetical protein